jgi:hypothetical protein
VATAFRPAIVACEEDDCWAKTAVESVVALRARAIQRDVKCGFIRKLIRKEVDNELVVVA